MDKKLLFAGCIQDTSFAIFMANLFIYVSLNISIFCILFLFDLRNLKTLNEIKIFNSTPSITIPFVIIVLSMAGVPPLLGFLGKFLLFFCVFTKANWLISLILMILNFFVVYFYVQNLRFLVSKKPQDKFCVKNYNAYINPNLVRVLVVCLIFNFFGFIFFEDMMNQFILINVYLY